MKPVIWMDTTAYPEARARLQEWATVTGPQDCPDRPWAESLREADGAVITVRHTFDAAVFAQAPRLQIVARLGVGYDNVDLDAATAAGVCVTITPGASTDAVAEHAIGLLLALARHLTCAGASVRTGEWQARHKLAGVELREKTLGIAGLGRIGTRMAEICRAGFRMRVLAYDPYLEDADFPARSAERVATLGALLAESDVVSLHVPATAETRHMIAASSLAHLKPGSLLVNTARGAVLDEAAVVAALSSGRLAGAALDVFDPEPPAVAHPLFGLPNVIVSPHIAGITAESVRRMGIEAAAETYRVLHGERPANLLNPEAWTKRRAARKENA